jgi:hypothetical protein
MELPENLKNLYRHWELHTKRPSGSFNRAEFRIPDNLEWFITERIGIWKRKVSGENPPYTQDPILAKYRFCNIFREFDRQTIEFHTMLNPLRNNFPLWLLNMFYCRMVARLETIKATGLLSFDDQENELLYKKLSELPSPRYGTPYVFPISAIQKSATPTRELFITKLLPEKIPSVAAEIATWDRKSVHEGIEIILPLFGYNLSFLWTEVLIDVAYQFPYRIDLFKRFPVGPGALPTFRAMNPHKDATYMARELCSWDVSSGIEINGKPLYLSAENWEGIGCEFRKYSNLKQGRGRKRIYDVGLS